MSTIGLVILRGASGNPYYFYTCSLGANLKNVGAIYALTKRTRRNNGKDSHDIIYIGQSSRLGEAITEYKEGLWSEQPQVNCVCIHLERDEKKRKKKVADIGRFFNQRMKEDEPNTR